MARQRSPAFFKILLDASAPHLPLPPDFVTQHLENRIPKHPIIRSVIGGFSWRIKITKIDETCCFSRGWNSVVEDLQLGFGDFLIFRFVDGSVFDMIVFSPNGCEKDLPAQIDDEEDDEDDEEDVVAVVDDDDDDEDEKFGDEDEDDEDEFEDGEEDDDEGEYEEEEKDNGDGEDDGDGDGEDDVDGGIDGDDGDPFFMLVISKSHRSFMRLPPEFVELTGICEGALTLKNLDGDEWKTGLRLEERSQSERYCISAGWSDFRRSNDLCDGDECVFKFIRSEEKLLLARVTKKRRPVKRSRGQQRQNFGESPAKKVVKRETELPAREARESPAKKVEKRNKQSSGESPAKKVEKRERELPARELKRNRGNPQQNSGESPAKKAEKRETAREDGGGDEGVEKRPRGRPARRK